MSADTLSKEVKNFNWLLDNFVTSSAGVCDAVAVSSDGLLMAMSHTLDRAGAERVAAIISGMVGLVPWRGQGLRVGASPPDHHRDGRRLPLRVVHLRRQQPRRRRQRRLRHRPRRLPDQPAAGKDRCTPDPGPHRPAARRRSSTTEHGKAPVSRARHTKTTGAHPPVHHDGRPYVLRPGRACVGRPSSRPSPTGPGWPRPPSSERSCPSQDGRYRLPSCQPTCTCRPR